MLRSWELGIAIMCSIACLALITDAVDCRRYVYAPQCRGISAKRSTPSDDSKSFQNEDLTDESDDDWVDLKKASRNLRKRFPTNDARAAKQILQEILWKYKELLSLTPEDEK